MVAIAAHHLFWVQIVWIFFFLMDRQTEIFQTFLLILKQESKMLTWILSLRQLEPYDALPGMEIFLKDVMVEWSEMNESLRMLHVNIKEIYKNTIKLQQTSRYMSQQLSTDKISSFSVTWFVRITVCDCVCVFVYG